MQELLFGSNSVGFLALHTINNMDDVGYLSSFLITDFKGIPLEFRCTHPIQPTPLQIDLYGETFLSYIGIELLGKPLIRAVKNKPKIIFIDELFLLDLAEASSCPIVFVKSFDTKEDPAISQTSDSPYHLEQIKNINENFPSLEIVEKKKIKIKTKELIEKLQSEFNLTEPFQRMKKAVETIIRKN